MTAPREPLVWSDRYATGVEAIDEQHMILVHTLNEAATKLAKDASVEHLDRITQDLLAYALYHFETEESLMQQYGYEDGSPEDAATHLAQHRAFSSKVVAVRDGIKAGNPITADDLLAFLDNWLINHILNTDQRLGAFIRDRQAAA